MAYENLCMYCFQELNGESICPHCGKDARAAVPSIQMLPGTLIYRDRFLVGRALGQDASGIVYTALDTKRGGVLRIREYLPRSCAERLPDGSVAPISGMEDAFDTGMKKLRMSVESVEDPRKRHFYFEENGTAYIAQRKAAASSEATAFTDADDEEGRDRRKQITLYIAIAAAVVLAVAIGVIWLLSSMSNSNDITLPNTLPSASASSGATWMPAQTPTPTPYTRATFAALVDPELSWMDYTYSGDVNSEFADQVTAKPTKAPTVDTGTHYDTVNNSSQTSSVTKLQNRLIELGWLGRGSATGKYDAATRQAVKDFQNYVNNNCSPATKLAVDGIAGQKTQQWLYNASVAISRPTATPTPLVTPAPDDTVVNASSSRAQIRSLQNKLIALGLLPEGSADGRFGSTTATAVKNFQIRVNQLLKYRALEPNGEVDESTMAYLNYYIEWWKDQQKATATPSPTAKTTATPAPTKASDGSVSAASSPAEIKAVQNKLIQVGALEAGGADGAYGSKTANAVKKFQAWVNQLRGEETLNTSGVCDALTIRYLDYCIENNRRMTPEVTDAPVTIPTTQAPTQVPTQAPTQTPTQAPAETPYEPQPGQDEGGDVVVGPGSESVSVKRVQQMLSGVGLLGASDVDGDYSALTQDAVRTFQTFVNDVYGDRTLDVTGVCDAKTLQYLEQFYEQGANIGDHGDETGDTDGGVHDTSDSDAIYNMQDMLRAVGLLNADDVDGTYGDRTRNAVRQLQEFVNDVKGEEVLAVTGDCDALTLEYLKVCRDKGWNLVDHGDEPEARVDDTPEPEQQATPEPAAEISSFDVAIDGRSAEGYIELSSGKYTVSWGADGAQSYYIRLYDGYDSLIKSEKDTRLTGFTLDTAMMRAGETYRLSIGALPQGGTEDEIVWRTLELSLAEEAATPEPEITAESTARPQVDAPVINIGSSVYQQDGVPYVNDSTIIFSWMSSGDVDYYTVTLVYQDGESRSLGDTRDTSKTVSTDMLKPGLYKLYVSATPVGGSADDTVTSELLFGVPASTDPDSEPTEAPTTAPGGDLSDLSDIQKAQIALYRRGLLNADDAQIDVLDEVTVEAITEFQRRVNAQYGLELPIIDPEDPILDSLTLSYLLDESIVLE